jgi:hypothetical protein
MSINNASATSRQFVAQGPFWGSKIASTTTPAYQKNFSKSYGYMVAGVVAFAVVVGGLSVGLQSLPGDSAEFAARHLRYILLAVLIGVTGVWYWWSRRRKILISATSDAMTVNTRPGDVYSFNSAKLGTWGITGGMTMGTALHLQSGPRRFVVGGRDFRVPAGTRLEAPDVGYGLPADVDARLPATDFSELLAIVSRRTPLDVRPPGPEEPSGRTESTRCLLFTNPLLVQEFGAFAFRKRQQFMQSLGQPRLALDVGPDAFRVIDPNNNALIASASAVQVTATRVTYRPWHWGLFFGNVTMLLIFRHLSTAPGLIISVPGMQPLTVGCRDAGGAGMARRFSWPRDVPTKRERADYEVSGADWQELVARFGLASSLIDHDLQR